MEVTIKRLGAFARVSAPKGMYAIHLTDKNAIIKTTMVDWLDDTDAIKAQFVVITPEEKAEIDKLNEDKESESAEI